MQRTEQWKDVEMVAEWSQNSIPVLETKFGGSTKKTWRSHGKQCGQYNKECQQKKTKNSKTSPKSIFRISVILYKEIKTFFN